MGFIIYKNIRPFNIKNFFVTAFLLLISLVFIYSRFVEPSIILTKTNKISTGFSAKIVVAGDFHIGTYNKKNFLERIVKKINEIEKVDAVLIPGDLSYYPKGDLVDLFSPLKNLKYPAFAVLGNHDSQHPGPPIEKELQQALEANNVIFLHNTSSKIKNINILGLGDKMANQDDVSKIDQFKKSDNLIVLTHNPDTAEKYKNSRTDITISGHTHGGQIRIPWLYKFAIPCKNNFDEGLYSFNNNEVFVSTGLGLTGLPLRLGVPPVINILELY